MASHPPRYVEYARFVDDLVILIDAYKRHDWLIGGRDPTATQHEWLAAVLCENYGYYGRSHNYPAFIREVRRAWLCRLRRRRPKVGA